jgi:hypothetical protein
VNVEKPQHLWSSHFTKQKPPIQNRHLFIPILIALTAFTSRCASAQQTQKDGAEQTGQRGSVVKGQDGIAFSTTTLEKL